MFKQLLGRWFGIFPRPFCHMFYSPWFPSLVPNRWVPLVQMGLVFHLPGNASISTHFETPLLDPFALFPHSHIVTPSPKPKKSGAPPGRPVPKPPTPPRSTPPARSAPRSIRREVRVAPGPGFGGAGPAVALRVPGGHGPRRWGGWGGVGGVGWSGVGCGVGGCGVWGGVGLGFGISGFRGPLPNLVVRVKRIVSAKGGSQN